MKYHRKKILFELTIMEDNITIVKSQEYENYILVTIFGEINFFHISEIKAELEKIIESNDKHIIMDFEHVYYIDSSGIGLFITLNNFFIDCHRLFAFINIKQSIRKIIGMAKLEETFKIFESIETALEEKLDDENP